MRALGRRAALSGLAAAVLLPAFASRALAQAATRQIAPPDGPMVVRRVEVLSDKSISMRMLFDPGHSLEERILREQFGY